MDVLILLNSVVYPATVVMCPRTVASNAPMLVATPATSVISERRVPVLSAAMSAMTVPPFKAAMCPVTIAVPRLPIASTMSDVPKRVRFPRGVAALNAVISVPKAPNAPISVAFAATVDILLVGLICPATVAMFAKLLPVVRVVILPTAPDTF